MANKLSKDYKVHIVSLHGTSGNGAFRFDRLIKVDYLDLPEQRLRKQMIKGCKSLKKYFKNNQIKVAFLEATYVGLIGSPLRLLSKTKIVFCDHGALLNQIEDRQITFMRRAAALSANRTVVLTRTSKNDYERLFRVRDHKITYIYNWISDSMINSDREYNIDSNIIMTAGRLTNEKGFDLLVDVAAKVFRTIGGWEWHIYGEGPLKEKIQTKINECGLQKSVILKGFTNNMNEAYNSAAMYVLPSYREGVPLVLLEAKAYKLPIVSFDIISGPNEIIEDNVNGILIKPFNTKQMAQAIKILIEDKDKRKAFSEQAYSNIDKFREESIYKQWVNLIDSLT